MAGRENWEERNCLQGQEGATRGGAIPDTEKSRRVQKLLWISVHQ